MGSLTYLLEKAPRLLHFLWLKGQFSYRNCRVWTGGGGVSSLFARCQALKALIVARAARVPHTPRGMWGKKMIVGIRSERGLQ